ncbi:TrbC/VirB2 family protein [Wolbachia endosymbiont of Atemnus politus]|nr:TrbC/VirB2 family protein [Wolbachia endosymbiont of Atemnus politus]
MYNFNFLNFICKCKQSKTVDETSEVICSIVQYTHSIGGPMITIVIIGEALLAIFGRMPWPVLFALGAFTAVFFGALAVVKAIKSDVMACI